jgi:hypothetical protein
MSYSKYLAIRSIDRITGSNSCSFQIQLREGIPAVKRVNLLSFLSPNTLYKIRQNVNDRFVWNRSSTNYNYQIPPASYSISSLLTTIQNGINAIDSNNYALSYSSDDNNRNKCICIKLVVKSKFINVLLSRTWFH